MRIFLCLLLLKSAAWATMIQSNVTLLNDSPFILTATVYTHNGDYLGQLTLQPGQQRNFTYNVNYTNLQRPGYPDASLTPFRIVWQCAGGTYYSMCIDGAIGSTIRANYCPGQYFCNPKEEEKKPEPPLKPKK